MGLSHHAENHIYDHTVQHPSVETTNMSSRNNFVNQDKALKTAVWGGLSVADKIYHRTEYRICSCLKKNVYKKKKKSNI